MGDKNTKSGSNSGRKQSLRSSSTGVYIANMAAKDHDTGKQQVDSHVQDMFKSLSDQIAQMHTCFDELEKNVSDKIVDSLTTTLTEQLSSIVESKIKQHLEPVKNSFDQKLSDLQSQLDDLNQKVQHTESGDKKNELDIVLMNLPVTQGENVTNKVNAVLKDGLKLGHVSVEAASRKQAPAGKMGIVIAKCRNLDEKSAIMKNKSKLKDSRQYNKVRIDVHKDRQRLATEANLRTIVKTLGPDTLTWKGSRVYVKDPNRNGQGQGNQNNNSSEGNGSS